MAVAKNKVDKCIDWLKLKMFEAWSDALEGVQDILKGARK